MYYCKEAKEERTSRFAEFSQRSNVPVNKETCDDRSHRLQLMRNLECVHGSSKSSEVREFPLQTLRTHYQFIRACTTPVLAPVSGEEQK